MGGSRMPGAFLAVALTAALLPRAGGQEPPAAPPAGPREENPRDAAPAPPRFEQSPLQLWLQPNAGGGLVPVPLFAPDDEGELKQHVLSWNDIDRLLDRMADQQSPRVSCQRVQVKGTVHGNRASLEIDLTFVTSPQRWVRTPLGLSSAVIESFDSPTGGFLDFDEKEGFVIWMPPAAPTPPKTTEDSPSPPEPPENDNAAMPMMPALQPVERTLKIRASAAVSENGAERRLAIRIPRAPASRLELLVDIPEAQANLVGSDALVNVEDAGTGQTRISAEGVGGDLAIFFRPKRTTAPAVAPVLKAEGILEVAFGESNQQIEMVALLTVQSFNEPFQSFTVKLPPGMRLTRTQAPDQEQYEATPVEPESGAGAEASQRVLVRLRQETIGPVKVRLEAASGPQAQRMEFVEVGGFEVEEAVEQGGRVSLIAAPDDSISWVESANVVPSSDAFTGGEAKDVAAQFRYFAQPFSLLVKAAPQKTRIRVEPKYVVEVFSDQVKLTADLAYQIHGEDATAVRLDLQGWELETVGGDEVVNPTVKHDQLAPLEIPFRTAVSGDVNVRVRARRIVEGAKGSLRIPLPGPIADFVVSALVAVAPNDNIELTPLGEQMHGLIAEPPAPLDDPAVARKATLFYRTRTGEPQPVFVADYEVKAGEITVDAEGEIRLHDQGVTVRQEFNYNFAYEPVDRLVVEVPREAYERGELQLLFDEAPILPKAEEIGEEKLAQRVRLQISPPMALGRHVLALEYSLSAPEIAPQMTIAHAIPLAVPVAADAQAKAPKMLSNTLRMSSVRPLQSAPDGSAWKLRSPRPAGAVREEMVLSADGPQAQLPLTITHQQSDEQLSNVVDRLWLQTWLTATNRRDHASLQATTHDEEFRVRLPEGADPRSLIVFLDGRRLSVASFSVDVSEGEQPAAVLTIKLDSANSSPFSLELWYGYAASRDRSWKTSLSAPEFLDVSWVRQVYWQLVLPPNEHVVTTPAGFTSEHAWRRVGWWWGREPTLGQADLEEWSKASKQPPPPGAANKYLFSSFGAPKKLEVYTAPRAPAVLAWSGLVLVLGLMLLRAPPRLQLRWLAGAALMGSLAVIAAVALIPEMAIPAMQCAAVGGAGVLVAWFFGRLGSPRGARSPISGGHSSVHSQNTASLSTRSGRRAPAAAPAGQPHDSSS